MASARASAIAGRLQWMGMGSDADLAWFDAGARLVASEVVREASTSAGEAGGVAREQNPTSGSVDEPGVVEPGGAAREPNSACSLQSGESLRANIASSSTSSARLP